MCAHPFAKEALTLHLARSEGCERYFDCKLMQRKVLASSHQHLMAEAPMFSKYPFFLLKLWEDILAQERDAYSTAASVSPLLQSFTPLASNRTYGFDEFVDRLVVQEGFVDRERKWRMEEDRILDSWLANRKNFQPRRQVANAQDAERYVYEAAIQTLISFFPDWIPSFNERNEVPNVSRFPALQVMLYSQYYRLWDPDWNRRPQEVTDIRIIGSCPLR